MIMLLKFSNFPDELSENDELREFELSGSDCKGKSIIHKKKKKKLSSAILYQCNVMKRGTGDEGTPYRCVRYAFR